MFLGTPLYISLPLSMITSGRVQPLKHEKAMKAASGESSPVLYSMSFIEKIYT